MLSVDSSVLGIVPFVVTRELLVAVLGDVEVTLVVALCSADTDSKITFHSCC